MPSAWRLTKTRFLPTAWDGEGARRSGGRWNSTGTAVVYASSTLSLALVETSSTFRAGSCRRTPHSAPSSPIRS